MAKDRPIAAEDAEAKPSGTLLRGAGLAVAHLVLTLVLLAYLLGTSMSHFDQGVMPQRTEALVETALDLVVTILMNPGRLVYETLASQLRADWLEWAIMILNSALWGFGLLFLWRTIKRRVAR